MAKKTAKKQDLKIKAKASTSKPVVGIESALTAYSIIQEKPFELKGYRIDHVDPGAVKVGTRIRSDMGDLAGLAESIQREGQIEPVVILESPTGELTLDAGLRRMRACQRLGIRVRAEIVSVGEPSDKIQFNFRKLMREIRENSDRKQFDALEEAEALRRSKELYERAYPQAQRGKHGAQHGDPKLPKVPKFATLASSAMGMSERKVYDLLTIAALPKAAKTEIEKATPAERNKLIQAHVREARDAAKVVALKEQADEAKQSKLGGAELPPAVVHVGDCGDFMTGTKLYDLVLTDPPYERGRSEITHTARKSLNPKDFAWDKLDVGWVLKAAPLLVPGGQLLAFCPLEYVGDYEWICKVAGLEYRQCLLWKKTNPAPSHRPVYPYGVEAIVWAVQPGAPPHFDRSVANVGAEHSNVFTGASMPGSSGDRVHPTQKPEWLITALLKIHAKAPMHVFDPFAGSGTTAVCARKLGMPSTSVERDPKFVEVAVARLASA